MYKNDYLIVGAGPFGATFAYEARKRGKKCLVLEKRDHIGGNIYTQAVEGIQVHRYGAHIFHTNRRDIWEYVNTFADFNHFVNAPLAVYHDEVYNLPFNMNTFSKLWGVRTPAQAKAVIENQRSRESGGEPQNLEEQALRLVGREIYEKLIQGYTQKQWGKACAELPAFIIRRLPLRFTYDNNYFNDRYQGIPAGGYTQIIEKMLDGCEVRLQTDYFDFIKEQPDAAEKTVFTGNIDRFYGYRFGALEYRSLRFETQILEEEDYQGNAVVNYTSAQVPYTRVIEHKHFELCQSGTPGKTVVTFEYPAPWREGDEPYYTVNDARNNALYSQYAQLAAKEKGVVFGGRLGSYRYLNMDEVIAAAIEAAKLSCDMGKG